MDSETLQGILEEDRDYFINLAQNTKDENLADLIFEAADALDRAAQYVEKR